MTDEKNLIQLPADPTNLGEFQQKTIKFHPGEGALYVQFVALTPQTLAECPDLAGHLQKQPAFLYVGSLDQIKKAFLEGFNEMAANYQKAVEEFNG